MSEPHYTYRVEWSPEDGEWVGLVAEFPSLSWLAPDPVDAVRGVRDLVTEAVADMRETGETPPEPLAERRYSGKVFLRTSPELHRRLTIKGRRAGRVGKPMGHSETRRRAWHRRASSCQPGAAIRFAHVRGT